MPLDQYRFGSGNDEPEEGDYIMTDVPNGVSLYQQGTWGQWNVFSDRDAAEAEILKRMKRSKFYPSVWWISDHGNAHRVILKTTGRRR